MITNMDDLSVKINYLFKIEEWDETIKEIEPVCNLYPKDHWIITRLGEAYYETKNYKKSLELLLIAQELQPRCPLVIWSLGNSLRMLDRQKEAIKYYKKILNKEINKLAYSKCGEGMKWALSLKNDARFMLAECYNELGKNTIANKFIDEHLSMRAKGQYSNFSKNDAKKVKEKIEKAINQKQK